MGSAGVSVTLLLGNWVSLSLFKGFLAQLEVYTRFQSRQFPFGARHLIHLEFNLPPRRRSSVPTSLDGISPRTGARLLSLSRRQANHKC
jgi:hypothetical protein